MMLIKFGSYGKEAEDINSGKIKEIIRKIDWHDPRFKKIEEMNGMIALVKKDIKDPWGALNHGIILEGDSNVSGIIKKISYKDGNVIIEWD